MARLDILINFSFESASPDIEELVSNAEKFLRENAVGSQKLVGNDTVGNAMLIKRASKIYEIHKSPKPGTNIIPAYLLGYKSLAVQGDKASFIDIPKTAGTTTILFTGELAGCSLIVTDYNTSDYRVFHDSRPLSSALYKKVVMAADLTDYIGGLEVDPNELLLTVCLQYNTSHKQWWLFAQLLKENGTSQHWRIFRPSQSQLLPSFFIRRPEDYKVPKIMDLRLKIQRDMERLITTINGDMKLIFGSKWMPVLIPTVQDGPFKRFDRNGLAPISTNPGVARTQALRRTITYAEDELRIKGYDSSTLSSLLVDIIREYITDESLLAQSTGI